MRASGRFGVFKVTCGGGLSALLRDILAVFGVLWSTRGGLGEISECLEDFLGVLGQILGFEEN